MTRSTDPRRRFALSAPDAEAEPGPEPLDAIPDESTVRLPHSDHVPTVYLSGPPEAAATLHFTEDLTERPTGRAPSPGPAAHEHRFGPGVPDPGPDTAGHLASVWHGTVRPGEAVTADGAGRRPRRRLLGGWLLPLAVLVAVLAYLGWQRLAEPLAVTGAVIRTESAGPGCDGTAVITGTLKTNGGTGDVRYRWKRSDGTMSRVLHQHVAQGNSRTDVVLRWGFDGHGTLPATATLEVLSPDPTTASVSFTYHCP